ncbi:MAG: phosphoribosylaminoimidazolesuccinocarboxamide synthase [Phycisphaerae bacterium]|nr:phosphoribosylaminoimidazolesuccinocarboxamide synthase [Phycisphaerae bacterium]
MDTPLLETDLPLPGRRQGKVRDLYDLPAAAPGEAGRLLIVATDRISAFDVVMPSPIVGKGRLLTALSIEWFRFIESKGLARTHLLSSEAHELIGLGAPPIRRDQAERLEGRIMIARRCRIIPIECVARGYLDGSGWSEYARAGSVCGVKLPPGLRRGDRLPEPIFTPATKEELGRHDENIDFDRACGIAGRDVMERLRALTLSIYKAAHDYAATRGLILADTKFEFGRAEGATTPTPGDDLYLCDEALTPDSSRYWDASKWHPGGEQPSFDKQFLREYLNGLTAAGNWNKQSPGPALPEEVIEGTRARYEEVRRRLFG